jgi:DNA-directed RNA polymerase specialized sigma24 family protein
MPSEGSVTHLLGPLQAGDSAAVEQLWQRYFHRLAALARRELPGAARRVADEEDVALSAFDSFCRRAEQGRFPQLLDRDSLWRLLVIITVRKAAHLRRDANCPKRGGGRVVPLPADEDEAMLGEVLSREPDPQQAAEMVEECRRLLAALPNEELRTVAVLKMEGYGDAEIGDRLGVVDRTVKRRTAEIRKLWGDKGGGG